ncbi:MarP family serine protease [Microbacteriaceae bacterium VKM Ac-2854]|nr:MarP family serine protease [Microbacteriaceae bacterium VKM Ac-2854]
MNTSSIVDVVVVLSLLGALANGLGRGFSRTVGGLVGGVLGAIGAYFAVPLVSGWAGAEWRVLVVVVTAIVLIGVGYSLGDAVGGMFRRGITKVKLGWIDRVAGGIAGTAIAALVWVMVTASIGVLGIPLLSTSLAGSSVIRSIDALTPQPVRSLLAQVRSQVVDTGTSWLVEAMDGPTVAPSIPSIATDQEAITTASASVVRVTGNAYECGVGVTGSGFVAAPDRIITNAHVVAGVTDPVVEAPGELPVSGRVVYVDAVQDLAVIATDGLDAPALPLDPEVLAGDQGIVAGYPFGGPLTLEPAEVVADADTALRIGDTTSSREVLTLASNVNQGNSGGPLLALDGSVSGVVFGKGTTVANVGYAIPLAALAPVVAQAPTLTTAVDSGSCATD